MPFEEQLSAAGSARADQTRRHIRWCRPAPAVIGALIGVCVGALAPITGASVAAQRPPNWEILAIRYATVPNFRVAGLIAGADTSRRLDIAMMVWLLKSPDGRRVLVDAGFQRPDLIARWKPTDYVRPDSAVARAGVSPFEVTDIIVSHIHWDHFDGASLFPNARIWIQREEVDHHIDGAGAVLDRAIDAPDAAMLASLRSGGRLGFVNGDAKEILPGITLYTGGKHTFASQYARVNTAQGAVVIASDNLYLYENGVVRIR